MEQHSNSTTAQLQTTNYDEFTNSIRSQHMSTPRPPVIIKRPSQTDSGFDESLLSCQNEIIINNSQEPSDTQCAKCCVTFIKRTDKRNKNNLKRVSLNSLKITDERLHARGRFVCYQCISICKKYHRVSVTPVLPMELGDFTYLNLLEDSLPFEVGPMLPCQHTTPYKEDALPEGDVDFNSISDHTYTQAATPKRLPSNNHSRLKKRSYSSPKWNSPKRKPITTESVHSRVAFKVPAIQLIKQSQYLRALKLIFNAPNRDLKRALLRMISTTIRNEIRRFSSKSPKTGLFCKDFNLTSLKSFNWSAAIAEAKATMPVTVAAVQSLFPDVTTTARHSSVGGKGAKRLTSIPISVVSFPCELHISELFPTDLFIQLMTSPLLRFTLY